MPEKPKPYNPLDYENLTSNLVLELMTRQPVALPIAERFLGPGVYAMFYAGDSPMYRAIRSPKATVPIYVGKAEPSGKRKGGRSTDPMAEASLYNRLRDHWKSINTAENLSLADFRCRYLVVEPLWITMSERFLIEHYQPAWNVCIEGFGPHDPGAGRRAGMVPWWDTLHPGRAWAKRHSKTRPRAEAEKRLRDFFAASAKKSKKSLP